MNHSSEQTTVERLQGKLAAMQFQIELLIEEREICRSEMMAGRTTLRLLWLLVAVTWVAYLIL